MELGSLSVNDRCGICNGDGRSCTTDENIVNNTLANSRMIVNKDLMQRLVTLDDRTYKFFTLQICSIYNMMNAEVSFSKKTQY